MSSTDTEVTPTEEKKDVPEKQEELAPAFEKQFVDLVKYENSKMHNGWNPPVDKVKDLIDDLLL